MKLYFVIILAFFSVVFSKTAVSEDSQSLSVKMSNILQSSNAYGRLTVLGEDRLDGFAFIELDGENAKNLVITANNSNFSTSLNCVLVSPLSASEGEFHCLNGDVCKGSVQEVGESVRMSGQCQKFGTALLVVPSFRQAMFVDVLSKTSGQSNQLLYDLAYNAKEQPAVVSQTTNNAVTNKANNSDKETTSPIHKLINQAEELCIELGFEEASDKLSTCILKTVKKLI